MTKEEALVFVSDTNRKLAGAFGFDVPPYSFQWDEEAEIIILNIKSFDGTHEKDYVVGYEDVDDYWLWHRIHKMLDLFKEIFPDWNKRGFIW